MSALPWMQHLIVVPVLLPLLVGALLIPVAQNRHGFKFAASAARAMVEVSTSIRAERRSTISAMPKGAAQFEAR